MKTIIILLIAFLLVGCQHHVKVGEWYEHKETRERFQVVSIVEEPYTGTCIRLTNNRILHDMHTSRMYEEVLDFQLEDDYTLVK
jgi:hypothetical protein